MTAPDVSADATPPVCVVIPTYGAAAKLAACLESLCQHLPSGCEVIVADDATPDESIAETVAPFLSRLRLTYTRRQTNLGFVENCNEAMRAILPSGRDVLLLNSDTRVTAGFLTEMWEVLQLHEKHGVVTPRSNNATIYSVPVTGTVSSDESYELWQSIRSLLPRHQVMPTGVGFCLLIRNRVLRQLGVFDSAYSPGYNEENDLICRMNRRGYSAVVAHRAFVFHDESSSFGPRRKLLERRNRELLDSRYPEYATLVAEHLRYRMDPIDHFATLWRPHRPSILYDLSHLPPKHSGTSDLALSLLLRLAPLMESKYDLRIGLSAEAARFFADEVTGYRLFDPIRDHDSRFDLVYKPAQLFTWRELKRMVTFGARIAFTQMDIIAVRCGYLRGPSTMLLFKTAAQLADRVWTISEFSKQDFEAYYGISIPFEVIHLATHERRSQEWRPDGYVLIVGNDFHHKAVDRAIDALNGVAELVALGGNAEVRAGIRRLSSGDLSRAEVAALYDGASVVVYPSFYEGFGIPLLDAAARGIPIVALESAVNREIRTLAGSEGVMLVDGHDEMRSLVSGIVARREEPVSVGTPPRSWTDTAEQYARSFDDLLSRPIDVDLLRRRWEMATVIDAVHPMD